MTLTITYPHLNHSWFGPQKLKTHYIGIDPVCCNSLQLYRVHSYNNTAIITTCRSEVFLMSRSNDYYSSTGVVVSDDPPSK